MGNGKLTGKTPTIDTQGADSAWQKNRATREKMRSQMPVVDRWAYFDHAAVGPLTAPAHAAISAWLGQATENGDVFWMDWSAGLGRLRAAAARLIHAQVEEIALIPNTSSGICFIAEGLDWRAGDNVVFPNNEFPSNGIVWENLARLGVEVRSVPVPNNGEIDLDALSAAIDSRTRLVSVSWVGFSSGYRIDLPKVCELVHAKGARLLLDAIQGMGVFPIDVQTCPIDFVVADGHKWMLGPEGAGFLYIRRDRLPEVQPTIVGWNSVQGASGFASRALHWKENATRLEPGSPNMVGMLGLEASLQLLLDLGADRGALAAPILHNVAYLAEQLKRLDAEFHLPSLEQHRSGIISFAWPGCDPVALRSRLLEAGVVLSVRQGKFRASLHAYNNEQEIERLVDALSEEIGKR